MNKKIILIGVLTLCSYANGMNKMIKTIGKNWLKIGYSKKSVTDDLKEANDIFLQSYGEAKNLLYQNIGKTIPVFVVKGDDLVVYHNSERYTMKYVPELYHNLKSMAHLPSSLKAICMKYENDEIVSSLDEYCKKYQNVCDRLIKTVQDDDAHEQLKKHVLLIESCKDLAMSRSPDVIVKGISQLTLKIYPIIKEASDIRLKALHKNMLTIKKNMGNEYWKKLSVIVMGPQMPRVDELGWQYFDKILDTSSKQSSLRKCPYSGVISKPSLQRLIYAESITEEEGALKLLVTHIVDEQQGECILGDTMAMHRDVLGDSTKELLSELGDEWKKEINKSE